MLNRTFLGVQGLVLVCVLGIATLVSSSGCDNITRAPRPDPAKFTYPSTVVADPSGDWVYVVSTNFDGSNSGGTIVPIEVSTKKVVSAGAVEVGSFAGEMALLTDADGVSTKAYIAIRDDDELIHLDLVRTDEGIAFACSESENKGLAICDDSRRLEVTSLMKDSVPEDLQEDTPDAGDPYAIAIGAPLPSQDDDSAQINPLYLGSLLDGAFLIFTLDSDGTPVFRKGATLAPGIHSIIERQVTPRNRVLIVSNRIQAVIHIVNVTFNSDDTVDVVVDEPVRWDQVSSTGDYFRGMTLSLDGTALYCAFNSPSSLAILDFGQDGRPVPRALVPLYGKVGYVATYAPEPGRELVYVTEFTSDALYAVDPVSMFLVDRIPIGGGPYGLAIAGDMAWVANFEEGSVSVVDLDPTSANWHQEIERLK